MGQHTSRQVQLLVNKQHYSVGETILVMIANGLSQTIWSMDHQTNCTVLLAEQSVGNTWLPVGLCQLRSPTRLIPLSTGSTTLQLDSSSWPVGTYRVGLLYRGSDEGRGGKGSTVHSALFTVG